MRQSLNTLDHAAVFLFMLQRNTIVAHSYFRECDKCPVVDLGQ